MSSFKRNLSALKDAFSQKTSSGGGDQNWKLFFPIWKAEENSTSIINKISVSDKKLATRGGEITFILLNILLLVFIISYNYEQFFLAGANNSLSNEIHQRIATVIVSIVCAIGIILFYFKSRINLKSEGRSLYLLSLVWIILNAVLVFSAFTKNGEYILRYGLTFKRISVFLFLIIFFIS